jgi:hypothetical protein
MTPKERVEYLHKVLQTKVRPLIHWQTSVNGHSRLPSYFVVLLGLHSYFVVSLGLHSYFVVLLE